MILPYMSIDLFFAGSFFLCRSRGELRVHAWRIALAFALSAAGFLLFPLRYGWPRPAVGGWLGALFAPLNGFDQPFNLCPSLHISLRALLWRVYGRHLPRRFGAARGVRGVVRPDRRFDAAGVPAPCDRPARRLSGRAGLPGMIREKVAPEPARGFTTGRAAVSPATSSPLAAAFLAALVKILTGGSVRWAGCEPGTRQRVYFANHTSHLDALVLWAALSPEARALARPVAARDYWLADPLRRHLATRVFNAVLIDRRRVSAHAHNPIEPLLAALEAGRRHSLILFPEGTRGAGSEAGPFKSGLYHLADTGPTWNWCRCSSTT